jgi:hypothetical protein
MWYHEQVEANRTSLISTISAMVKGENFDTKKDFVIHLKGLEFLSEIIVNFQSNSDKKQLYNLLKKCLLLLQDLIGSDGQLVKDKPYLVKNYVTQTN